MKLSDRIRPISDLKANAPEVVRSLAEHGEPVVLTVHGTAKAVIEDIESFERNRDSLALSKILALANRSVAEGRARPARDAFAKVRSRART
jgi:prevent-host-death family protein